MVLKGKLDADDIWGCTDLLGFRYWNMSLSANVRSVLLTVAEDLLLTLMAVDLDNRFLKGFRNDFKAAMDKIDLEFINELAKGQSSSSKTATDIKINDDGTTLDDIQVKRGLTK